MNNQTKTDIDIKTLIKRVSITASIILLITLIATAIMGKYEVAISILAGWLISCASFIVLVLTMRAAFTGKTGKTALSAILGITKLLVLGIILWWLIVHKLVEPISFMIGFSAMIAALLIEGARFKNKVRG